MPYESSPELEPDAVICPGGPTLFQMLEPYCVVGSYHWPLEDLPILCELLQMSSQLISNGIHLSRSCNSEISIDNCHEGQILAGGWLPIWSENKLMRPYSLLDCCGVRSHELAKGYPWPPPGLSLAPLLPSLLIVSGGYEWCVRRPPVYSVRLIAILGPHRWLGLAQQMRWQLGVSTALRCLGPGWMTAVATCDTQ